jgi:hypothetical protein
MRPDLVVIVGVTSQDAAQVSLAQNDEVIDALAPDRSDEPFCKAILPRRRRRYRLIPDAHDPNAALNDISIAGRSPEGNPSDHIA